MSRAPGGRHEGPRRASSWLVVGLIPAILAVIVLIGALVATGVPWTDDEPDASAEACTAPPVRVGADPAIADVLTRATADLEPWLDAGECLTIQVRDLASGETAAQLTRDAGTGFAAPLPDIWVPDSSLWLAVAGGTQTGEERLPETGTSIASSPVVVAVPAAMARRQGWPDQQPTWQGLLNQSGIRVAMTDPRNDPCAAATLLALMSERTESLAAVARRFSVPITPEGPTAALAGTGAADAVPTSEVAVIRTNQASGSTSVVAGYDPSVSANLDFPMVPVAPGGGDLPAATERAAEVLRAALLSPASQQLFGDAGLRTSDGALAATWGESDGVLDRTRPAAAPYAPEQVRSVMQRWTSVGRRFRLLMLVDRSGSMAQPLPGSSSSKATLAQAALDELVRGLAPDSDMGLWSFTTGLPGGDVEELVGTGPVAADVDGTSRRDALLAGVRALDPKIGGATPLYDAVLAGFTAAQRSFAYGRLNALVVVSDGRNQDPASISLPQLLDRLRLQFDGVRPVRIITVAYGARADAATLRRISLVTGGRSYLALDPSDISRVLTRAVANL